MVAIFVIILEKATQFIAEHKMSSRLLKSAGFSHRLECDSVQSLLHPGNAVKGLSYPAASLTCMASQGSPHCLRIFLLCFKAKMFSFATTTLTQQWWSGAITIAVKAAYHDFTIILQQYD